MKKIMTAMMTAVLFCIAGLAVSAQSGVQVKGVVVDAIGPVVGATVFEQGTTNGASTGLDGDFILTVSSADAVVEISCIGYVTQTFRASAVPATVVLVEDTEFLDDVVVIGYGTVKKNDLTGSVTALKPDTKNKGVIVNPQDLLSGKVAGVNVTSGGGSPGGGSTIRIRGGSSLNASNEPLIVIDGIAMDNVGVKGLSNGLSMVNPQDIESFNVLKDASATAIYGSRGSNGVIIITTKKGRMNQAPTVSYNGSATLSMKKKTIEVMDGDQFRQFVTEMYGPDHDATKALGTANTNWQDLIYRKAFSHDHSVTLTGATKHLPYRVSFGFTDESGILKTTDFKRATVSLNLNPTFLDDHLSVNLSAKGMYAWSSYADTGAIGAAVRMDPTQSVYDTVSPDRDNFGGYFAWKLDGSALNDSSWPNTLNRNGTNNPVAMLDLRSDKAKSRSVIGSAEVDYKVHGFEDLRIHMTAGADLSYGRQDTNVQPTSPLAIYYGSYGYDEITKRNLSFNTYVQYNKDFKEIHHVDAMVGYEWQHFWRKQYNDYNGYYPQTNNDPALRGQETAHVPYNYRTENYLVSFFGRANYSLLDRYLLTATVRYDGSSRFRQHWSLFPSFAFAWKVKEESFLKNVDVLSDLKLRLGWGQTGQQDGIGDYNYFAIYEAATGTDTKYPVTGDGQMYRPMAYDANLRWETTTTANIGLDFGFMNDRLTGSVDLYDRKTTDLLNTAYVAAGSNFKNQVTTNIGSLRNRGAELTLDYKVLQTDDWFWTLSYNATYNVNEITDLNGGGDPDYYVPTGGISSGTGNTAQAHAVGHPASSFYVYQQVYDKNGVPLEGVVVDRNGDGQINESDKYFYKSPMAPVTMGLSSRLEYKNWDFGMSFRLSLGNYVYNDVYAGASNISSSEIWALGSYLSNRPTAVLAKNWQTYDWVLSDYFVKNGSFLKCDNITLGYSFENLFKTDKYKGLAGRIYGTASNVFTITKYDGIDPEVFGGIDNNLYPRPISFILGLSLNF